MSGSMVEADFRRLGRDREVQMTLIDDLTNRSIIRMIDSPSLSALVRHLQSVDSGNELAIPFCTGKHDGSRTIHNLYWVIN